MYLFYSMRVVFLFLSLAGFVRSVWASPRSNGKAPSSPALLILNGARKLRRRLQGVPFYKSLVKISRRTATVRPQNIKMLNGTTEIAPASGLITGQKRKMAAARRPKIDCDLLSDVRSRLRLLFSVAVLFNTLLPSPLTRRRRLMLCGRDEHKRSTHTHDRCRFDRKKKTTPIFR